MPKHRKPPAPRGLIPSIPTLTYSDHNYSKSCDEAPCISSTTEQPSIYCHDGFLEEDPLETASSFASEEAASDFIPLFEPAQVDQQVVPTCEVSCFEDRLQLKHELAVAMKRLSEMRKKYRRSNLENVKLKMARHPKKQKRKVFKIEDIEKALKLRISCGPSGYETVRKEYPHLQLPCQATLHRQTKKCEQVSSKILDSFLDCSEFADVTEFLEENDEINRENMLPEVISEETEVLK